MKCFSQQDYTDFENPIKSALFSLEDLLDNFMDNAKIKNIRDSYVTKELHDIIMTLENLLERAQDGEFD